MKWRLLLRCFFGFNSTAHELAPPDIRYHKRESAKRVRGYSAGDLAAILGGTTEERGEAAPARGAAEIRAAVCEDSEASSRGHVSEEETGASGPASEGARQRFWWSTVFVRAGRMGSTKHELKKVSHGASETKPANGFSEQDQEDLYTQVWGREGDD